MAKSGARFSDLYQGVPDANAVMQGRVTAKGYTIDGPEARNLEDGFNVIFHPDGRATVQVSLSDAPAMVPVGSALDREAQHWVKDSNVKGGKPVQMLPSAWRQSNLSLNHNTRRPAVTFIIDVDAAGGIESCAVKRTAFVNMRPITKDEAARAVRMRDDNPVKSWFALAQRLHTQRKAEMVSYCLAGGRTDLLQKLSAPADAPSEDPGGYITHELMSLTNRAAAVYLAARGRDYMRAAYTVGMRECYACMGEGMARDVGRRYDTIARKIAEGARYARVSSPSRRYEDLVNLRAVCAAAEAEDAPHAATELTDIFSHVQRVTRIFNTMAVENAQRTAEAFNLFSMGYLDQVERILNLHHRADDGGCAPEAGKACPPRGADVYQTLKAQTESAGWRWPQFSVRALQFEGCKVYAADILVQSPNRRYFSAAAVSNDASDALDRAAWAGLSQLERADRKSFKAPKPW